MRRKLFIVPLMFMLLAGCVPASGDCDAKAVILDQSFFPGEVSADPLESPIHDAPPESAERLIYIKTNLSTDTVQQDVMNFGSIYLASDFFKNREKQLFRTDVDRGPWETPEELAGLDLVVDESHLACGIVLSSKTCRWVARYAGYYVYLRSDISESGMTVKVFGDAVKEIDARMDKCLAK